MNSGASYSFDTDPQILDWFEADHGLISKAPIATFGPLVETSGAVALGALNGRPVWALTSASGGYLTTARAATTNYWYQPYHVFLLVQDTGSALGNKYWSDPQSALPNLAFASAATLTYTSAASGTFAGAPAGWHLYEIYCHSNKTMVSIDGAAYIPLNAVGVGGIIHGITLGAGADSGGARSKCNIAMFLLYEAQATDAFKAGLYAYVTAKYGIALAAPRAQIDLAPTVGVGLLNPSFDIIVIYGQSNGTTKSSVATTTPNAGILNLNPDNTISQMGDHYCLDTGRLDEVCKFITTADSVNDFGGGGALANAYQAATGRQLVILDRAVGGAWLVASQGDQRFHLGPEFPRGRKLRNCGYGALVASTKALQVLGGNVRWLWFTQGEAEGTAAVGIGDQWPASAQALWASYYRDIGMAGQERVVFTQIAANSLGPNWTNFRNNTQPLAVVPGKYLMATVPNGPYEADGVHWQGAAVVAAGANAAAIALAAGF